MANKRSETNSKKVALQCLASASESLIAEARAVRTSRGWRDVTCSTHLRDLTSGAFITLHLEVRTPEPRALWVSWVIEVKWEPTWIIKAGIRLNRTSEEESILDFPTRTASTSAEFCQLLADTVDSVRKSIAHFDETRW
jgi:hypothetical protein